MPDGVACWGDVCAAWRARCGPAASTAAVGELSPTVRSIAPSAGANLTVLTCGDDSLTIAAVRVLVSRSRPPPLGGCSRHRARRARLACPAVVSTHECSGCDSCRCCGCAEHRGWSATLGVARRARQKLQAGRRGALRYRGRLRSDLIAMPATDRGWIRAAGGQLRHAGWLRLEVGHKAALHALGGAGVVLAMPHDCAVRSAPSPHNVGRIVAWATGRSNARPCATSIRPFARVAACHANSVRPRHSSGGERSTPGRNAARPDVRPTRPAAVTTADRRRLKRGAQQNARLPKQDQTLV